MKRIHKLLALLLACSMLAGSCALAEGGPVTGGMEILPSVEESLPVENAPASVGEISPAKPLAEMEAPSVDAPAQPEEHGVFAVESPAPEPSSAAAEPGIPETAATSLATPSPEADAQPPATPSPEASATSEASPAPEASIQPEVIPSPEADTQPPASPSPDVEPDPEPSPSPEPSPTNVPEDYYVGTPDTGRFHIVDGVLVEYHGPDSIRDIVVPEGVTVIGPGVFRYLFMYSVSLPDSVRQIGNYAFANCRYLKNVRMDGVEEIGEGAFRDCEWFSFERLPSGLRAIGASAFMNCPSIDSVEFPSGVKKIPSNLFYGCTALSSVSFHDGIESIGASAFSNTCVSNVRIPGSVKTIGNYAFYETDNMNRIVIMEGVKSIGEFAFAEVCGRSATLTLELPASLSEIGRAAFANSCDMLAHAPVGSHALEYCEANEIPCRAVGESSLFTIKDGVLTAFHGFDGEIIIPAEVTAIGPSAFKGSRITSVQLHNGITSIGDHAFENCAQLREIQLPPALESIGYGAFSDCKALREIRIPASVQSFGASVFPGCISLESVEIACSLEILPSYSFENCTSLKSIVLPDSLEEIHTCAFSGCKRLAEIALPDGLTYLSNYAFSNCHSLARIELPKGVATISDSCFANCSSLLEIELPSKLKELGMGAFRDCSSLASVKLPRGIQELESGLFYGCSALKSISIPDGATEIGNLAFGNCTALEEISIPASVSSIVSNAFDLCPKLNISGKAGSYAEEFALARGIPFNNNITAVQAVRFTSGDPILGVKQNFELNYEIEPANAYTALSFTSSNTKVATVNAKGVVTAKAVGSAVITMTAENGVKSSCTVTVKKAPSSIKLSDSKLTLGAGESYVLEYTITSGCIAEVGFTSEDPSIAVVDAKGRITAVSAGETRIRVRTHNGKTATCKLSVKSAPTRLSLEENALTIRETQSATLTPILDKGSACLAFSYASSNPGVVSVDAGGRLAALSMGEATVTVSTYNGLSVRCSVTVIARPPAIHLSAGEITLGVGDSYALDAEYISYEGTSSGALDYSSSSSKYASVSPDGLVTAKRAGKATIIVRSSDGTQAACAVTVKKAPSSIKLSPAKAELGTGDSLQLSWKLSSSSAAASLRFSSDNPDVLEVSDSGLVTAKSAGMATVSVQTHNGKKAACAITVYTEPESVRFEAEDMKSGVGHKGVLAAILNQGSRGTISYASSNPLIFAIDAASGSFEAMQEGEVTVTATTHNGLAASCTVKILAQPTYMAFAEKKASLGVGESWKPAFEFSSPGFRECLKEMSFKSSNSKVASVDENGVVTAKKAGSATITATTYNGIKSTCKVTVKKAPTSIRLNATEITLGRGESFYLEASVTPSSAAAKLSYTASDDLMLWVDNDGKIYANGHDYTGTVTVSTYNGLSATCTVTIGDYPDAVYFPMEEVTLAKGAKALILARPVGGVCNTMEYEIEDTSIAAFNSDFELVAKKPGSTVITVRTYNDKTARLTVHVVAAPKKYSITLPDQLELGRSYNLLEYFSSDKNLSPAAAIKSVSVNNDRAIVTDAGYALLLTPVETGSFKLTIKTANGKTVARTCIVSETNLPFTPFTKPDVNTAARRMDYWGGWLLREVSIQDMACPPELLGIGYGYLEIDFSSRLTLNEARIYCSSSFDGSHEMRLMLESGEQLTCRLHENGMLSVPLEEGLTLWFGK